MKPGYRSLRLIGTKIRGEMNEPLSARLEASAWPMPPSPHLESRVVSRDEVEFWRRGNGFSLTLLSVRMA